MRNEARVYIWFRVRNIHLSKGILLWLFSKALNLFLRSPLSLHERTAFAWWLNIFNSQKQPCASAFSWYWLDSANRFLSKNSKVHVCMSNLGVCTVLHTLTPFPVRWELLYREENTGCLTAKGCTERLHALPLPGQACGFSWKLGLITIWITNYTSLLALCFLFHFVFPFAFPLLLVR